MSEPIPKAPLSEVAEITMGQSPDSAYVNEEEHGWPFLQGCAEFGARHPIAKVHCSPPLRTARAGSTLISVRAPVGAMNCADQDYCIGRGLAAVLAKPGYTDNIFLLHAIEENLSFLHRRSQGSTFLAIGTADLSMMPVAAPPLAQQQRIAEILATVDEAIEQTEALIAKTQQIKAGLMHDLFTRGLAKAKLSSLPNTTNARTPYGFLPKGWAMGSLLDIADQSRQPILTGPFGADLGNDDFVEEGVPVLRIGNVQAGYLDLSDLLFISPRKASELQRYAIKSGDLLFARQGATTGRNALATQFVNDCIINYHIIRVALDHAKCSPSFIEAAFNQEIIKRQIEREKGRGTREGINTAQLKALKVPLAPLAEQRAIAEVLSGQNEVIQSLSDELSTLKNLRFGLMHDLLTGRVRVKTESVPPTESTHV